MAVHPGGLSCLSIQPTLSSFITNFKEYREKSSDHGLSGSCTCKEMQAVRKLSVWYKIPFWFQNTVCPNTKYAFPKIQAWAYNRCSRLNRSRLAWILGSFWKIPRRLTATKPSAWKSENTFFQSQSWLWQLAYFITCKRTLLEIDEYLSTYHIQVHEENEFCHCLFTSFTKREISHFHG